MPDRATDATRPQHPPSDAQRVTRERRLAILLIVVAFGFALVAQSLLFSFSTNMHGDAEYHRGVAYTMISGRLSGEGPIHGVITYFGGTFPFLLGFGSQALGVSFDGLLSVISWPVTLVLPFALLVLGRAIWPRRTLEPALLVFIGTIGSSLGRTDAAEWVFSALPSGANEWPLYPRDIALLILIFAIAIVVRNASTRRLVAAGALCAFAIATHAQFGIYTTLVVAGFAMLRSREAHGWPAALGRGAVVGTTAVIASSWWWIPRLIAAEQSRRFLLASYPGLQAPDSSVLGLVNALGVTGLLAFFGLVFVLRSRVTVERWFGWWLALFIPLAIAGRFVGDSGFLTERRIWFFASVPLVVCAAAAAARGLRALPTAPAVLMLVALILVPSVIEVEHTRNLVDTSWGTPPPQSAFGRDAWKQALPQLRDRTVAHDGLVVLAPDADALYVWQQTGAQPFSLWLTGPTKLGFDPARLTDWGMLERLRLQNDAFRRGLPGLCDLARRVGARDLVLRHRGPLLGVYDLRPASRYRVAPEDRAKTTIERGITGHEAYYDHNNTEFLGITPPQTVALGFSASRVREVQVQTFLPMAAKDAFLLVLPNGREIEPTAGPDPMTFRYQTPDGVPGGTRLRPRSDSTLERVIGFVPSPDAPAHGQGVVDLPVVTACTRAVSAAPGTDGTTRST
jgi:hypothetical protein